MANHRSELSTTHTDMFRTLYLALAETVTFLRLNQKICDIRTIYINRQKVLIWILPHVM